MLVVNKLTVCRADSLSDSGVVWERLEPEPDDLPAGPRPSVLLELLVLDLQYIRYSSGNHHTHIISRNTDRDCLPVFEESVV